MTGPELFACRQGHPYTEANTRIDGKSRKCRACDRERQARSRGTHGHLPRLRLFDTPSLPNALCAIVPGDWFAHADSPATADAIAVCGGCPERVACLAYALKAGEVGVWGGTTPEQRKALKAGVA